MDIAIIAQEKINKLVSDGSIDTMIETQIKKTLESTISDVFREYSDFGKDLKKVISDKLKVNLEQIDIPLYSNKIMQVIKTTLVATALEPSIKRIQESVNSCLNQIEKKNWKLSEIIRKYLNDNYGNEDATYETTEPEYSSFWVNIGNKKASYSYGTKNDKDLRLIVDSKTNVIRNVWYQNKPLNGLKVDRLYNFEMFLMGLWINECVLEIDEDESDEACIRENECHC
jgi:hypothetical protein